MSRLSSLVYAFLGHQHLAGRDAPLYHATESNAALEILASDRLQGGDDFTGNEEQRVQQPGVSLTRSLAFAQNFGDTIFELNQAKLAQRYKLVPRDYFGLSKDKLTREMGRRTEAEEFIAGDISPVRPYIESIRFSPKFLRTLLRNPVLRADMLELMAHPKFDPKQKAELEPILAEYAKKKPSGLMQPRQAV